MTGFFKRSYRSVVVLCCILVLLGVGLRLYHIHHSDFIFYDEGYYLNYNRLIGEMLMQHFPRTAGELRPAIFAFLRNTMASGKSLWFLLVDSRLFFGGLRSWYLSRMWAALSGIVTLLLTFCFARRYYHSRTTAWLAVGILAVLPSHVFYSRIGLQEAFSTLLVLAGFYFYVFPKAFSRRTFLAGVFCGAAFFANYRLIMLPALIGFIELFLSRTEGRLFGFRKYLWFLLTFLGCVFIVGNFDGGRNTQVIFAWIFHQAEMAGERFIPANLLSYPYYLWRLDGGIFPLLLLGNLFLLRKNGWKKMLPLGISLTQMLIFSFAGEKGARYLCVALPFLAMAAARVLVEFSRFERPILIQRLTAAVAMIMVLLMIGKSAALAKGSSDYRQAAQFLAARDPQVKFLSTQNYVQNLYVRDRDQVAACPRSFEKLLSLYSEGFRYLVIDPQAYISWTEDEKRFLPDLAGYLGFIRRQVTPLKVYGNFNQAILERFVCEHSENLPRSIRFLDEASSGGFGNIYLYDLSQAVPMTLAALSQLREGSHE